MAKKRTTEPRSAEYYTLGINLADARNAAGMSQAEAAAKIGIPQSTYSGYETGSRRITLPMIKKIASVYGVNVDLLIGNIVLEGERSDEEERFLRLFRYADEETKKMVLRLLEAVTK